ncbi:MAG TPA: pyrroline-5-carboxylate reductase [Xanthomonadales bacterium]|nr:pyrroline-5-carboxylate reductase [Xanthomonadales bacterium]
MRIGFVGGGNMARSLLGGLVAHGHPRGALRVSEPNAALRDALARDFAVECIDDNLALARQSDVVVLAVKPQVMAAVCRVIAPALAERRILLVSIAAGITIAQLERLLGAGQPVVRAMPNTPALIGEGIAGLVANEHADASQRAQAATILEAAGRVVWIERESLMDAVTAVSGSGPAYFFLLIEALEAAAVEQGLPPAVARELTLQTALGAARMAREAADPPATLRERVTSPGGTTQAALDAFEAGGFRALVATAVARATERGRTLSAGLGE